MLKCKIRPSGNTCSACVDMQIDSGKVENCKECKANVTDAVLLNTYASRFMKAASAVVVVDGLLKEVEMDRVYDITFEKEEK